MLRASCVCGAIAILLAWAPFLAQAQPSPAPNDVGRDLHIVLWGGMVRTGASGAQQANLILDFETVEGAWKSGWGLCLGYNNGMHPALVTGCQREQGKLTLTIGMTIAQDQYVKETGAGLYTVTLQRNPKGDYEGTYTGNCKGVDIKGDAIATLAPPRPMRVANFKPVAPGEHPRILFRKADIPRLQEKLKTPLGQAYLAAAKQAGDPINAGMLYALTGEKAHADRAQATVRKWMENAQSEFLSDKGAGSGGFGHTLVATAVAYDLCFDAWPEDFRKELDEQIMAVLPRLLQYLCVTSHANNHPCSNYYGPGYGSPAIAALLYYADKGEAPPKPKDPLADARAVSPLEEYTPGEGVSVVDFAPGELPAKWLWAGPLSAKIRPELIQSNLGGRVQANSVVKHGTMVGGAVEVQTKPFKPLPAEMIVDGALAIDKLAAKAGPSTNVLFTVLKVKQETVVSPLIGRGDTMVWLDDTQLSDSAWYRLKPGLHPMLVVISSATSEGAVAPRLCTFDSEMMKSRRAGIDLEAAMTRLSFDAWQKTGADPVKQQYVEWGRERMMRHYRLGIGDGGFQAETGGYAMISSWYPLVYATLYRNVFGRDASPYPDATHLVVRRTMQCLIRPDGSTFAQKLNSVCGFDVGLVATTFPIIPDQYKPGMLWAWNTAAGIKDGTPQGGVKGGGLGHGGGLGLAFAFLNYPLDLKPEHPTKSMPLAWEAPTFGHYTFRSGWEGTDEFIAQVFLKAVPVCGWNHANAASLRMFGLGHNWDSSGESREGAREQESVVLLPDDKHAQGSCARLAYLKTEKDGSASLTMDMNDVYASDTSKRGNWDNNLLRSPGKDVSGGIQGLRALAYDYSAKSGAPAVMVMVDKITGGKRKLWTWNLPGPSAKSPKGETAPPVKIDGNTFTLAYPDASMKATFISPAGVKITSGVDKVESEDARHSYSGNVNRVKAEGADPTAGDFMVVITFQKKDAPAVQVDGRGLDAKITVGQQKIRFDGQKIIFGE